MDFVTFLDLPKKDAIKAMAAFKRLRIDFKIVSTDDPNVIVEVCRSVVGIVSGDSVVLDRTAFHPRA